MYCSKCGKEMKDSAAFCPSCGTKVADSSNSVQTETPMPEEPEVSTPADPATDAPASDAPSAPEEPEVSTPADPAATDTMSTDVDQVATDTMSTDDDPATADASTEASTSDDDQAAADAPASDAPSAPEEPEVSTPVDQAATDTMSTDADQATDASTSDAPSAPEEPEVSTPADPAATDTMSTDAEQATADAEQATADAEQATADAPTPDAPIESSAPTGLEASATTEPAVSGIPSDAQDMANQYQQPAPGMPVQQPAPGMPIQQPPKKSKRTLIIVLIVVVVLLAAAAVAVFAFDVLGLKKSNPIGVTYDGIKSVFNASSFDATITATTSDGEVDDQELNFSIIWGEGLADTVFDAKSIDHEYNEMDRAILIDDALITNINNIPIDDPDSVVNGFLKTSGVTNLIESALNDEMNFDLKVDDLITKEGLDIEPIDKDLTDALNTAISSAGLNMKIDSIMGILRVLEDFANERCSDEKVLEKIVSDYEKSKSDGNTVHKYNINVNALISEFSSYLDEISDDDSYLKKQGLNKDDAKALSNVFGLLVLSGNIPEDIAQPTISVTVDKNGNLVELVVTSNTESEDGPYSGAFTLKIDNYNNSKMDLDELKKIKDEAKEEDSQMDDLW